MKKLPLLAFFVLTGLIVNAQSPNWAQDVAPIFYQHCTTCHHEGGIGPFSLISYQNAYTNALDISSNVTSKKMPPWPPDVNYSHLAFERILTQDQINTITEWVNNGAPEGDSSLAPAPPVYSSSAQITAPDLEVQMPAYTVNTTTDLYRCFPIATNLSSSQYITQIEVVPGNRSIVHHVLVFQDPSNTCFNLDAADPGPGYTDFGGVGSYTATLVGGWVPGSQEVYSLPPGMGIKLSTNTNIIIQVHYPAGITNQVDSTKVLFKLSPGPLRQVSLNPLLNYITSMTDGPLYIPANDSVTFHEKFHVPGDYTMLDFAPHMHLIGKTIKTFAVTPTNDTIPFVSIPNWDFHWQGAYSPPQLMKIPAGSNLYAAASYNNMTNTAVSAGENTTDEMMIVYFAYTPYQPGDENIIIDSSEVSTSAPPLADWIKTLQFIDLYPNPASDEVNLQLYNPHPGNITITIRDLSGRLVGSTFQEQAGAGYLYPKMRVDNLAQGLYFVSCVTDGAIRTKSFIKE